MRRAEPDWLRRTIAELKEGNEVTGPRSVNSKGPQINPERGVNRHPRRPTEG